VSRPLKGAARRRRRAVLLICAGALAALAGSGLQALGTLEPIERESVDARFGLRGAQTPPDDIVVVGVDAKTFQLTRQRWPFRRSTHARVVDRLRAAGARVIAYDVQFSEPTEPEEDGALLEAIADTQGRVVLAGTEVNDEGDTNVLGGADTLKEVGAVAGMALMPRDNNGVIRRVPFATQGVKSFAVVTAQRVPGQTIDRGAFDEGNAWIDFHGGPGTLDYVSMADVLFGNAGASRFRGKIVVIGAVAPSLQDVAATSTSGDRVMSGPEIQAEAISTVLRNFPLRGSASWLSFVVLLGFAAVPPLLSVFMRPLSAFFAALVVGGIYLVVAKLAFDAGRIIPVAEPVATLALSAIATLAVLYLFETFERRRVRDYFAHFVPEQVVDDVLAQTDGELRLGGTRRVCTALFSDLRGFTSYAETRPPDQVIDILNGYLTEMTDAILDHGGTLISFMGDGIYAIFGAPIEQPDHADRAVATAREMLERLERFNVTMRDQGHGEGFRMGIGLNSGPVMCGNVGSERRLEYTAIGDTVNTASRIEGMTKGTSHSLFLAESTYALLTTADGLVYVDELEVRGRKQKVKVWGMVAPPSEGDGVYGSLT